jgi:hypothetical protein
MHCGQNAAGMVCSVLQLMRFKVVRTDDHLHWGFSILSGSYRFNDAPVIKACVEKVLVS